MQVSKLLAVVIVSTATLGAASAMADEDTTNAVGTASYSAHSMKTRQQIGAELRAAQVRGAWHPVGEVGAPPIVRHIQQDAAPVRGQTSINVAQGRVWAKKAQAVH